MLCIPRSFRIVASESRLGWPLLHTGPTFDRSPRAGEWMSPELRARLESSFRNSYAIERELAGGGMARVFVAREMALGRQVVIKVLSPELAAELSAKRFEREIRLAASLQQANIVPVLAAGEADGVPYYTMPYVDGLSVRDRLRRDGRLPLDQTIGILRDVGRALAFAHERGVVHRDIKPENVLLSGDAAVVTDFGIAKAIAAARASAHDGQPSASTVTQAGTAVGTPAYMAPEQITADPIIDHRADLYSFGCLGYELLAGQPPFGGPAQALFAAHLTARPPSMVFTAEALANTGRSDAAANLMERLWRTTPQWRTPAAAMLAELGHSERALELIRVLSSDRAPQPMMNTELANLQLAIGDTALGLASLERATSASEIWPTYFSLSEPRFRRSTTQSTVCRARSSCRPRRANVHVA
jgi:serine/threonine protein kinase